MCIRVTSNEDERKSTALKSLQLTQNRMLRALNGTKIKDKISIKYMLNKFGLLSVNQLAAQIKLTEVWKALNVENYAIQLEPYHTVRPEMEVALDLRPRPNRVLNDDSRLAISKQSFSIDAARLWNNAPAHLTSAPTLGAAKSAILTHVKSFPV